MAVAIQVLKGQNIIIFRIFSIFFIELKTNVIKTYLINTNYNALSNIAI